MEISLLLEQYYNKKPSPECESAVLDFLSNNEDISHKGILFTKKLTKVASNILSHNTGSLDGLLRKLFQFNINGAEMVKKESSVNLNHKNRLTMESHFYSHAGYIAQIIFEKTEEIIWAVKSYWMKKWSADIINKIDPKHSAHSYSFAADTARTIFIKTKHIDWAEKCYHARIDSAELSKDFDPKHSAHSYGFAGQSAQILFVETGDINWAKKCYHARIDSAELSKDFDAKHSAHSYSFAGQAADNLFIKTKEKRWAKKAIKSYRRFLNYYESYPNHNNPKLIYTIKSNIYYLKKSINQRRPTKQKHLNKPPTPQE